MTGRDTAHNFNRVAGLTATLENPQAFRRDVRCLSPDAPMRDPWSRRVKFLPLLWAGIWRNTRRTVLLILQIGCAFLLFGLLQGVKSGMKQAIAHAHTDRLYVGSSVSLGVPLPISMLPQRPLTPGVKSVTPLVPLTAFYQKPEQALPFLAGDPQAFFTVFNESAFWGHRCPRCARRACP